MSKLLVVTGATGSQGRAVIDWYQKHEPTWKIRGMTRTPSSDAGKLLASQGVEVVQADLNDKQSIQRAFAGANVIFAYTVFIKALGDSAAAELVKTGRAHNAAEALRQLTVQQGIDMADVAATVPELERLVFSSMAHVTKWSGGKYTYAGHADSKAEIVAYMRQKEGLKDKVAFLQMGPFADNLSREPENFGFRKAEDGTLVCSLPVSPSTPLPFIDVARDTGSFVSALCKAEPGIEVLGVSEWMSFSEYIESIGTILGVQTRFEQLDRSVFDPLIAADKSGGMRASMDMMFFIDDFGYTGGDPDLWMPEDLEKAGFALPRTKIDDHTRRSDWSKVLRNGTA